MNAPPDTPDHELLRLIGRGASGEVWLARNVMGTMRAVKVVRRSSFESPRPFEREFAAVKRYEPLSRAAAGLVNVLHAGRAADSSFFYYVMELADAAEPGVAAAEEPDKYQPCTLRTQIGRLGRMPVSECINVAVTLANGIADLHRIGLVHRDVKPSNIIFVNGRAKLADIGLLGEITESRSYVGTDGYVPPEGPGQPPADLFALGRVLYEMATGLEAMQFPALPPDWTQQQETSAFEFYEIVMKCCEPDTARRYQTADALLSDLMLLQSGQSVRQLRQMRGRLAVLRRIAVVAAVAGLLGTASAWWQRREAGTQRRLVARAERAEAESRENLFATLVQGAHNARLSGAHDARFTALDLLERAAILRPGDREVREEFIAALATPGLRRLSRLDGTTGSGLVVNRPVTHCLEVDGTRHLVLHALRDGSVAGRWSAPDVQALFPVGVSDGLRTVYARDDRARLLSWRDGAALPPLPSFGAGDCHWSLSPDQRRLVAWRGDGTVTVVDPEQPEAPLHWQAAAGFRFNIDAAPAIAADGSRIAFSQAGGQKVFVHSLEVGRLVRELPSPRGLSSALTISGDGSVVAAGFSDGGIGVWRLNGSAGCEIIEAGYSFINVLALPPDGRFLVSSCWTGATWLWDLTDGSRAARIPGPCGRALFSADGTRLAIGGSVRLDLYEFSGAPVCQALILPRTALHSQAGAHSAFTLHPRQPWLLLPAPDGLLLVDAASAKVPQRWPFGAADAQFTSDGHWLYLAGKNCTRIPLTESGGVCLPGLPEVAAPGDGGGGFRYIRATADGSTAVGRCEDRSWRIITRDLPVRSLPASADESDNMSLSPDGRLLGVGLLFGGVRIYRTDRTGKPVLVPCSGSWPNAWFSADGQSILVSDTRGLRLLDAVSLLERWHRDADFNGDFGRFVWLNPDGLTLLTSWQPGTLVLLDAATGKDTVTLRRGGETQAACLAASQDGSMIWESDPVTQTLWRWDLHTLRKFLRARHLDWTTAPLPPAITKSPSPG